MDIDLPKQINYIRVLGEVEIIAIVNKHSLKMQNKEISCIFTGYAEDYNGNYCRIQH